MTPQSHKRTKQEAENAGFTLRRGPRVLRHAPGEDERGDGAAAGGERGAEAEAPRGGGDDGLLEQEHEQGGDAVHRGGVGVVEAVGAVVVLVRHHLPLRPASEHEDLSEGRTVGRGGKCRGEKGRETGRAYGAAAALGAHGEEEGEEVEEAEEGAEAYGGRARGGEAAHRSRAPAAAAALRTGGSLSSLFTLHSSRSSELWWEWEW